MPTKMFQDDQGNQSSFRAAWVPFVWAITIIAGFVGGFYIRELLSGGENAAEWLSGLKVTGGTGIGAFVLHVWRKWVENSTAKNKASTDTQAPSGPIVSPKPLPPPVQVVPQPETRYDIAIDRIYETPVKTLGEGGVWNGMRFIYTFKTIELPWRGNERFVSRIPAGLYDAVAVLRNKDGKYAIQLVDVPGRTAIQIHIANYFRDLLGCFGPGTSFKDIDNDGYLDVTSSTVVMAKLKEYFPLGTSLKVWVRDSFEMTGNLRPNR